MIQSLLLIIFLADMLMARPLVVDEKLDVTYAGSYSENQRVEYFQGIHNGQDTSGINRFAPPRPAIPPTSESVIDVSKPGAACARLSMDIPAVFAKPSAGSEDCLTVFTARLANHKITATSSLPVLAWLHGGGAMFGSGNDPHTSPDKLIDLSVELGQPVIFVSINYRLSVFGFAASDTLRAQKSENVSLRDQRLAFEWLQANIATFGGDPNSITAHGLSVGGTFTSLHHVSYGGSRGVPCNQAFMMSGPTGTARNQTTDGVKIDTAAVVERLECPSSGQEMLDCMRKVNTQKLIGVSYNYAMTYPPPMGLHTYIPVADGDFIPERASNLIHEGRFVKNIPTILAWTEDDGAMNVAPAALVQDEAGLIKALEPFTHPVLGDTQLVQILEAYPIADFEELAATYNAQRAPETPPVSVHWYRASAFVQDLFFTCSSIDFTHQMFQQT